MTNSQPMDGAARESLPAVSLVIPVLDEADNIVPVTEEIFATLAVELDLEVVFVDDGSRDATSARIAEVAGRWSRVRSRRHRMCCGKSAALVTGVQAARAPWIATMDGDGQNDPTDIRALVEAVRRLGEEHAGPVMASGRRRKRRDTWLKRLSSRTANTVRARLLHDDTQDTACGLKAYRRDDFLAFPRFDNMHRFLPALTLARGGAVVSVDVDDRPRAHGTSKYGFHNRLWAGIYDLMGVMWLRRRTFRTAIDPGVVEDD